MSALERPAIWSPRRSVSFWRGLAATVLIFGGGMALRLLVLGPGGGLGIAPTYFPVFILITLYAGWGWGAASLLTALVLAVAAPTPIALGYGTAMLALFVVSGAATVAVAAALRAALLRLRAAAEREVAVRQALDRSEARLRLAQEAGGVGLWDWDLVTRERHWSPALYRNLGLSPSGDNDLRALLSVIHPDDRERVRDANVAALREGRLEPTEYRVVWPDGQVRWLLQRGEVLRTPEGRILRAAGVNIDITERRLADEQVRESEARFRALADSAPVLLWVSRTDGSREFANRAYVDFLGVGYEGALAFDWRERLDPQDLPRILAEQQAGETSRALFTLEARYRRADGVWRWMRSFSQPRHSPTGEFIGFIGIAFDVTDAKQAEADLMRINDLLAERVQAALSERDEAEAQLRHAQKMEAVGQLTGGVAHDFNNLLTVVIGALDLIQRRPDERERRDRMIEAALSAARRGERLTHQLLAFSRRQALKPENVRIDDLLHGIEPLLRRAVGESVDLAIHPAAPEAVALVDPGQFEAALMNLVVNARDAVAGGGAIAVASMLCDLELGEVAEIQGGSYVCVEVRDTGVGMAPETISRVFEPFFTTKEVGKGTGLGLSQVYGFARQSGGGVTIESAPGQGSSVRLYLPRSRQVAEDAGRPSMAAIQARGPQLRVLLAEDDPAVATMVAALLEDLGHQVTRAADAQEAVEIFADAPFDLLLTDLIMPGSMTGVDLARELTQRRPSLPVILSSGYTGEALTSADGAPWPLLRKPYSAEELAAVIARVVRQPVDRTPEPLP